MKNLILDIAWWMLTLTLLPFIVLLTLLQIVFIWYDPIHTQTDKIFKSVNEWRFNLFN